MPSESVSHFNIRDARTHLSWIIARVEQGEEIIICRAGQPVVKLVPLPCTVSRRGRGSLRGKLTIADDWNSGEVSESIAHDFGLNP